MGFSDVGVPSIEGITAGDAGAGLCKVSCSVGRRFVSCGAGLLDDIRLPSKSIFVTLLCWLRVNWQSLVFSL